MHAIHFGAYETEPLDGLSVPTVYGHSSPEGLHEPITLGYGMGALTAYVSGSWACWGPADNGYDPAEGWGDGDPSIHIVVSVPDHIRITPEFLLDLRHAIYAGETGNSANYRLLDYAVISDDQDWSVQTHTALFRGHPEVSLHATHRKGFVS